MASTGCSARRRFKRRMDGLIQNIRASGMNTLPRIHCTRPFPNLHLRPHLSLKTLIQHGIVRSVRDKNHRLPTVLRKVLREFQPPLHPRSTRWRPVIGDDQHALGGSRGRISWHWAKVQSGGISVRMRSPLVFRLPCQRTLTPIFESWQTNHVPKGGDEKRSHSVCPWCCG